MGIYEDIKEILESICIDNNANELNNKTIERVSNWLDSPSCSLTSKEEECEHEIVHEPNGTKHCLNCDYEELE